MSESGFYEKYVTLMGNLKDRPDRAKDDDTIQGRISVKVDGVGWNIILIFCLLSAKMESRCKLAEKEGSLLEKSRMLFGKTGRSA